MIEDELDDKDYILEIEDYTLCEFIFEDNTPNYFYYKPIFKYNPVKLNLKEFINNKEKNLTIWI